MREITDPFAQFASNAIFEIDDHGHVVPPAKNLPECVEMVSPPSGKTPEHEDEPQRARGEEVTPSRFHKERFHQLHHLQVIDEKAGFVRRCERQVRDANTFAMKPGQDGFIEAAIRQIRLVEIAVDDERERELTTLELRAPELRADELGFREVRARKDGLR